jgi:hypothetical protein
MGTRARGANTARARASGRGRAAAAAAAREPGARRARAPSRGAARARTVVERSMSADWLDSIAIASTSAPAPTAAPPVSSWRSKPPPPDGSGGGGGGGPAANARDGAAARARAVAVRRPTSALAPRRVGSIATASGSGEGDAARCRQPPGRLARRARQFSICETLLGFGDFDDGGRALECGRACPF